MVINTKPQQLLNKLYRYRVSRFVKNLLQHTDHAGSMAIARQFYPSTKELQNTQDYINDPLQETQKTSLNNVIHKYHNKILLLTTEQCPVYCRYCTRKRKTLIYNQHSPLDIPAILNYIESHPEINEVILSGGDPFILSNQILNHIVTSLLGQSQIHFIRYHTRAITTIPHRFNDKLLFMAKEWKQNYPTLTHAIVLHINHPSEITKESRDICQKLIQIGYVLYSQSVLLRKINNSVETLTTLFIQLKKIGIQPYYLHQLDKVTGSGHFYVEIEEGIQLMKQIRDLIPPYLMPRYVIDSKEGKTNLYY